MNIYEGMFLFEARERADWEPLREHAVGILEKNGAKILREEKWAERKLAYEIKKVRRGIYYLTYFEADAGVIDTIRRECTLSESVLRVLIIRKDALPEIKPKVEEGAAAGAKPEGAKAEGAKADDAKADDAKADDAKEGDAAKPEGDAAAEGAGSDDAAAEPAAVTEGDSAPAAEGEAKKE
ncbi:MAG: hypothetical protein DHS20C21_23590 [Gemmatimonadota bacterium]|nr:MAG: hypothetical protein DHS20C21_23590 [Gemmatimonadota bacterium]